MAAILFFIIEIRCRWLFATLLRRCFTLRLLLRLASFRDTLLYRRRACLRRHMKICHFAIIFADYLDAITLIIIISLSIIAAIIDTPALDTSAARAPYSEKVISPCFTRCFAHMLRVVIIYLRLFRRYWYIIQQPRYSVEATLLYYYFSIRLLHYHFLMSPHYCEV